MSPDHYALLLCSALAKRGVSCRVNAHRTRSVYIECAAFGAAALVRISDHRPSKKRKERVDFFAYPHRHKDPFHSLESLAGAVLHRLSMNSRTRDEENL